MIPIADINPSSYLYICIDPVYGLLPYDISDK